MIRRTFVATTAGLGAVLLAGCSGGGTDDGGTNGSITGTGSFRLLISDQPALIEDFDSLNVTLSSARIFQTGDDEEITSVAVTGDATGSPITTATNTTVDETVDGDDDEGEGEGFLEFDLDSVTVDLTQVVGDRAISVLAEELEAGRYSGIELRVTSAEGLVEGEAVDVKVPSNRLRIIRPFEIGADEELDFVFDINVVQKGPNGGYNLLPVIGKSGVAGEDIEVDEIDN